MCLFVCWGELQQEEYQCYDSGLSRLCLSVLRKDGEVRNPLREILPIPSIPGKLNWKTKLWTIKKQQEYENAINIYGCNIFSWQEIQNLLSSSPFISCYFISVRDHSTVIKLIPINRLIIWDYFNFPHLLDLILISFTPLVIRRPVKSIVASLLQQHK